MSNPTYMSREGLEKLKEDLHDLKTRQRQEIAKAIQEAREKGDLSENAEYDAAKDAQGLLEMRIAQLEDLYSNARVVDDSSIDTDKVHILSNVKLLNKKTNTEVTYRIVSTNEASLKDGKISIESPIGKGLLGKAVGDEVEIEVPAGKVTLKVLDITR
jgi:transcription elongation factor GreA